jgi:hypothetical protein
VRGLAVTVALDADPTAHIVVQVARVIVGEELRLDRDWGIRDLLGRIDQGLTAENARERVRFLAGKIRALSKLPFAQYTADITSLRAGVEEERETLIVLAHYLVRVASHSRLWGTSTAELQQWFGEIPGAIGGRVTCQVLAEANDVPLDRRIAHVTSRLESPTATGDDRDLVRAILTSDPDPRQLDPWRIALGMPSHWCAPPEAAASYPDDWARAWLWSAVLPSEVPVDWQAPIRLVSVVHDEPSDAVMNQRHDPFLVTTVQSPLTPEELGALSPVDAARRVASRPDGVPATGRCARTGSSGGGAGQGRCPCLDGAARGGRDTAERADLCAALCSGADQHCGRDRGPCTRRPGRRRPRPRRTIDADGARARRRLLI